MATQVGNGIVQLPDVQRLSTSVIRILGGNPGKFTLQGTNTYLIGQGPHRLLLDTGEGKPNWPPLLESVLLKEQATIRDVILTHWHHDHVSGVRDVLRLCPDATVSKNAPGEGQENIWDGQVFEVEGATLRAFHCPGHTTDHMAFILNEEDAMFTGDNVLGHGTAVFEDLATYISSLEKMQHQFAGRAYPGHGDVIQDGKGRIVEYIKHRQQREDELMQVLRHGHLKNGGEAETLKSWGSMELVKVIYWDVPESLHDPAEKGVMQVLRKLQGDGKVARDGDKWRVNGRATL